LSAYSKKNSTSFIKLVFWENNKSEQEFHLEKSVMLGKNYVPFEEVVNSLKRVFDESGRSDLRGPTKYTV